MSAHTPGPWTMEYVGDSKALVKAPLARTGQHEPRTFVLAKVEAWTPEQTQATARLIAAAPELLEALEQITKSTHHITLSGAASRHLDCPPCIAEAAIRAAKGETA